MRVRDRTAADGWREVRGPDGRAFAKWRAKRSERHLERYGLDVRAPGGGPDRETVRVMRNARKRERQEAIA